jgi:sigma-B regulation protein RsbU (phosphoserine phosphatase)
VTALLCIQRPIHELERAIMRFVARTLISMLILAVIASRLAAYFVHNSFVKPIRKVSAEAARFAIENTKGEELGDVSRYEEIYNLSRSIDKMETDMVNYIHNLTTVTAERERIGAELSFAKNIQSSSLPSQYPAFPERMDFDIYGCAVPAREVGGDFYSYMLIDDDHLCM